MITVNGEPMDVPEGTAVGKVVSPLIGGYQSRGVAVALNGEVVPRAAWDTTLVSAGDRLEVLTATQGG